jgi:hypothetical protein
MLGYKLRKHISKALQARSQAIRAALGRYNDAAKRMVPPRQQLNWDEIVEYGFLSDFELLRDTREDVRKREWARPAIRVLTDQFFKLQRAREEISRLNVEIRRVVTHIRDEEICLQEAETRISNTDPVLASHIGSYRNERMRYSSLHLRRFAKLAQHPGFTGTLMPGVSVEHLADPPAEGLSMQASHSPDYGKGVGVQEDNIGMVRDPDDDLAAGGVDDEGASDEEDKEFEARVSIFELVVS